MKPLTTKQINTLIATIPRLKIPESLRAEWRQWPMSRRADFIERVRARLKDPKDRPILPFSKNVDPFDYASPRAHAIVKKKNEGKDHRHCRFKIRLCSQGVIYKGLLWFWSWETGYTYGPFIRGIGRPVLHRTIWEEHNHRKLTSDDVIRFADGNCNNLDLRKMSCRRDPFLHF